MITPEYIQKMSEMHARLCMLAWQQLVTKALEENILTEEEFDYAYGIYKQSIVFYENIEEFTNDILNDPAALQLQQAAMSEIMEKWKDR